jgi:hypothetical protein
MSLNALMAGLGLDTSAYPHLAMVVIPYLNHSPRDFTPDVLGALLKRVGVSIPSDIVSQLSDLIVEDDADKIADTFGHPLVMAKITNLLSNARSKREEVEVKPKADRFKYCSSCGSPMLITAKNCPFCS